MPRSTSKPTNPWRTLDALMDAQREPEGPQWFTGMEFAERYKLPRTTADRRLDALFRAGNLERWTGPIKATGRHGHKYRLKQP